MDHSIHLQHLSLLCHQSVIYRLHFSQKRKLTDISLRFLTEIAMLLPGSLSHSRTANNTSDIRKNLRLKDPSENPQYDPEKT